MKLNKSALTPWSKSADRPPFALFQAILNGVELSGTVFVTRDWFDERAKTSLYHQAFIARLANMPFASAKKLAADHGENLTQLKAQLDHIVQSNESLNSKDAQYTQHIAGFMAALRQEDPISFLFDLESGDTLRPLLCHIRIKKNGQGLAVYEIIISNLSSGSEENYDKDTNPDATALRRSDQKVFHLPIPENAAQHEQMQAALQNFMEFVSVRTVPVHFFNNVLQKLTLVGGMLMDPKVLEQDQHFSKGERSAGSREKPLHSLERLYLGEDASLFKFHLRLQTLHDFFDSLDETELKKDPDQQKAIISGIQNLFRQIRKLTSTHKISVDESKVIQSWLNAVQDQVKALEQKEIPDFSIVKSEGHAEKVEALRADVFQVKSESLHNVAWSIMTGDSQIYTRALIIQDGMKQSLVNLRDQITGRAYKDASNRTRQRHPRLHIGSADHSELAITQIEEYFLNLPLDDENFWQLSAEECQQQLRQFWEVVDSYHAEYKKPKSGDKFHPKRFQVVLPMRVLISITKNVVSTLT